MKNLIQAAVVTLFAASAAQAQQAVQWKVSDGGNGHWYQGVAAGAPIRWMDARDRATAIGGHLATPRSSSENNWIYLNAAISGSLWRGQYGPWLGIYQDHSAMDYSEPAGGWRYVDGTPVVSMNWADGEPNNEGAEDFVQYWGGRYWNDKAESGVGGNGLAVVGYVVEWDADCNSDGIVDYGQILSDQLADSNGNGIPDICEGPTCHDADLYPNGRIDGADLGILLSEWGPVNSTTHSDFNRDGRVDGADLGFLLANWGPCSN
jgi:Lectin C-type domain